MFERKIFSNYLYLAIINVLILSIAHMVNNTYMLYISIMFFCGLIILPPKEHILPLLLFYIPWNPIIKIQPDGFTFFSIIIPVLFLVLLFKHKKINLVILLITLVLILLTISAKIINSYDFNLTYIRILIMFAFIPYYFEIYSDIIDFKKCIYYLTIGIITACISSQVLLSKPGMEAYIIVDRIEQTGLTRFNGFYGDANFFAAHILLAISGLLILIEEETERKIEHLLLFFLLSFFGLQSVSKMFLIIYLLLLVIWFLILLAGKKQILNKIMTIISIVIIANILVVLNVFDEQINYYILRFSTVTDVSSLTTNRSDLLEDYLEYFNKDILSAIIGVGLSSSALVNNRASHNTFIQMLFQLGLLGIGIVSLWLRMSFCGKYKPSKASLFNKNIILLFIGCFASWLSLDMLMFEEFFYFIILFFIGRKHLNESRLSREVMSN